VIVDKFVPPHPLKTPVLFLIFNRLDTTKQVFEAIRKAEPPRLYIASDGPRENKEGEKEKVETIRKYVLEHIDWDCEVKTLFRDKNLGCGKAVSQAITWFFENEEMGIILEDDCLPSQSFFWFCEELLERYKDDERIGMISGFNYGYTNRLIKYSYYFSKYPMIWGWASWRNRWLNCDFNMNNLYEVELTKQLLLIFDNKKYKEKMNILKAVKENKIDTWDYQWSFNLYLNNQLTIIPKNNYIINIGFGYDATHTKRGNCYEKVKNENIKIDFVHPPYLIQDIKLYKFLNKKNNILINFLSKFRPKK